MSYCVFCYKTKCNPQSNWPLGMVLCPKHLRCPFGLEVQYHKQETETEQKIIGPFLRLAENVFFKKNTVVFPCREFVDKTFRPDVVTPQTDDFNFHMNPEIVKYFRALSSKARSQNESDLIAARYGYEVLRNFGHPYKDAQMNADDQNRFVNFFSDLQQNLTRAEQKIKNLPVSKQFDNVKIPVESPVAKPLADMDDLSESYKLLLVHCMISEHYTSFDKDMEISRVPFNLVYKKGYGLVTTEDMGHPHHLVVYGEELGSQIWYLNKVSTIPKNVSTKNVNSNDIQGFFTTVHSLQGASDTCMF